MRKQKLKRQLFNLAVALSLALCALSAILWARSNTTRYTIGHTNQGGSYSLFVRYGKLVFSLDRNTVTNPEFLPYRFYIRSLKVDPFGNNLVDKPDVSFAGFGFKKHGWASLPKPTWIFLVPMWFLTVLSLLPTALWILMAARNSATRRKQRNGLCPNRGYDLRASPGRCPECGTVNANDAADHMRSAGSPQ